MKILMVNHRYRSDLPSGEAVSVDLEIEGLRKAGAEVELYESSSDHLLSQPQWRQALLAGGLVWSQRQFSRLRNRIRSFEPDVVHFQNTFPTPGPAALWACGRTRVVATLRNYRNLCAAATRHREGEYCGLCVSGSRFNAIKYRCYAGSRLKTTPIVAMQVAHDLAGTWTRRCDRLITTSSHVRDVFIAAGWPAATIDVKYNAQERWLQPTASPSQRCDFVYAGRLAPEKGLTTLLEAWNLARPQLRRAARLLIAGTGPSEAMLRAAAGPDVVFLGHLTRDSLLDRFARARAVLIPSRWEEPFGRSVPEAYSVGTPVIAARSGGLSELVQNGHTGFLYERDDVSALAHHMTALAASAELLSAFADAARKYYEAQFSLEATTADLLSIYERAGSQ